MKDLLVKKLQNINQEHILDHWDILNIDQKQILTCQIEKLDEKIFLQQQKLLRHPIQGSADYTPYRDFARQGLLQDAALGLKEISDGNLGCIVLAGGQGTRLKFEGPKGMYPISPIKHKTLYQLFAEKTLAASNRAGKRLQIAFMTSPINHEQTLAYFKQHSNFGLDSCQISFFTQGMLPLLDEEGNIFLETPFSIAQGPDGNGSVFRHFVTSGLWEEWYKNNIRFINLVLIDNPLADSFDDELLGYHLRKGNDITCKCTYRHDVEEKVGLLLGSSEHARVVEYTEMPVEEWSATNPDGTFKHCIANLSLFCLNMDFCQEIAAHHQMPLHLAFKAAYYLAPDGKTHYSENPFSWKFERFVFDVLPHAQKVGALLYPREKCFAPLKNGEGDNSVAIVQKALKDRDRDILARITGLPSPSWEFELAQDFYYPTPHLLNAWKGRTLPHRSYITASEV